MTVRGRGKTSKSLICQLLEVSCASAAALMAGKWAIGYAYLHRGRQMIGSEYLFILMTYLVALWAVQLVSGRVRKRRRSRREDGGSGGRCLADTGNIIYLQDFRRRKYGKR